MVDLQVGTILKPTGENMLDGDIEEIIDDNRPEGCPPRCQHVFMVADLDGFENVYIHANEANLYSVRPNEKPRRCDHAWVNAIWRLVVKYEDGEMPKDVAARCAEYARNYWAGTMSRFGYVEPPMFEYLAPSATVVRVLRRKPS